MSLKYKTKIHILANDINIVLNYKPFSWYEVGNTLYKIVEGKNIFQIKDKNNEINFDKKKIILGCIENNILYKLEITHLKILDNAKKLNSSYLKLKYVQDYDAFSIENSSHYECDITLLDKILIDIPYWLTHQNNEERIEKLATKERIDFTIPSERFESKEDFLDWYKHQQKECCYCGIKEKYLKLYFNKNNNPQYYKDEDNKARQRGKYLEIERIVTLKGKDKYSKDNCALACYVCNNAKSDFLSPKSFKPIAKGINEFWNKILKKSISHKYKKVIFPEKSKIWDKK